MKQLHKRIMSLLLVLGILVSLVPISAAEPEEEAGELRKKLENFRQFRRTGWKISRTAGFRRWPATAM